ncbi:type I 3-dehydroquinate dehydratase [Virgibacillus dokdonensis]|uniref:3-dehydroquinate dehydratase n=1 Tax=Virgibacillus dokdonensis TaxID=302167 RepID=A0A2K9ITV5_9BACI|nr:type I 3-dehydroquinate dehydratase [Virgibacillus dokdonensis]AUJ23229.1 3-dehydroquinate dehydratase [Virgibacillus dokdonensis]
MKRVKIKDIHIGKGMPKIIIPIMGETLQEINHELSEAKQEKPDMIEWRADAFLHVTNIEEVLRLLAEIRKLIDDIPLLYTFRTYKEGGRKEVTLNYYEELLSQVIQSGFIDVIDVELYIEQTIRERLVQIARQNNVIVLMSNHDFQTTPANKDMLARLIAMQETRADIVKLAVMPQNEEDVLRLLQVAAKMKSTYAQKPFITIAMGPLGILSRVGGEVVGSAASFGSAIQASAPGQITAAELRYILQTIHRYSK